MKGTDRWAPIAAAGTVIGLGAATTWASLVSNLPVAPSPLVAVADLAAGWSFAVVGALLWVRFPDSRVGPLTVAVGFASFIAELRWLGSSLTWTLGSVLADVHLVALAWVVLAFPTGRLHRNERLLLGALTAYFIGLSIAGHLFEEIGPGCVQCPDNLLLIRHDPSLSDRIWGAGQVINLGFVGALVAMIARKWTSATRPARKAMSPVMWALGPIALALAAAFLEPLIGFGEGGDRAVRVAERLALIVFPAALATGMVRTRLARARVADLARSLETAVSEDELEHLLSEALGDPSAELAFWSHELGTLIDAAGHPINPSEGRRSTVVERNGEKLGVIIHDPSVDAGLVEAVGATAGLALHNERLRAELRARLAEVEASRERIAEAGMTERRRLERDLHDGAQQRLLALGALLGQARAKANGETAELLTEAIDELRGSIDDLRKLARGVHPALLTERGLVAAIRALAERSPIPVTVEGETARCRPAVEAAAYFLVAEALTNAARHASAAAARVRVESNGAMLRVEIGDDGTGGADPAGGTGLEGLRDRLAALGGTLEVTSGPDGGTRVIGSLPCG